MLIQSLYLSGYKPLLLRQIDSIDIDIVANTTLILGTNGSGKSSVLRELTPYPAAITDYKEGGQKIICLEYANNSYVLTSTFKRKAHHSFLKNGIELNEGGTSSIQKELVEKEFNYNNTVHRLLIGDLKFTEMSTSTRREILTAISPVNLDYALHLHKITKEALRDTQGAIKHITLKSSEMRSRLETLNCPEDSDVIQHQLENKLNLLIPYTTTQTRSIPLLLGSIDTKTAQLQNIKTRIDKTPLMYVKDKRLCDYDTVMSYIGECLGKKEASQTVINILTDEVDTLSSVDTALHDGSLSQQELDNRIKIIEAELLKLPTTCFVKSNHRVYLNSLISISSELEVIQDHYHGIHIFSNETITDTFKAMGRIQSSLTFLKNKLNTLENRKLHFSHTPHHVNCPQCELRFDIHGLTAQQELLNIEKEYAVTQTEYAAAEAQYKEIKVQTEAITEYQTCYNLLLDLSNRFTMPFTFWDNKPAINTIIQTPNVMYSYISQWTNNLTAGITVMELQEELNICKRALSIAMKYDTNVGNRLSTIQDLLTTELQHQSRLDDEISYYRYLLKTVNVYKQGLDMGEELLKSLHTDFCDLTDAVIQEDARSKTTLLYDQLAKNRSLLNSRDTLIANIAEMDSDYTILTSKAAALTLLVGYLSPDKGLIAEQMLGFITSYITEINTVIRDIWEYVLEVKVCNYGDGVLDYTFPLQVEDSPVPDVSKGSTGQADIINLAFTLVMRQYLGLTDYPLYLDEVDSSFDEQHRFKMFTYVKRLLDSHQCSQLFMINHYTATYGGLSNHDIVVLDDRNITVPAVYNTNVQFTYKS